MSLSKVLIVNQPFNKNTGGGITLSNLFAGWDTDKVAVISVGHMLNNLDYSICTNIYQLGQKESKVMFPLNFVQKKFISGPLKIEENSIDGSLQPIKKSKLREKFVYGIFYPFLTFTGIFHSFSRSVVSAELMEWIEEFNPDVIYAQVSSMETILFCKELHSRVKKPMAIHMMDDWPTTISNKGLFKKSWERKIDKEFRRLLNSASALMSISDEMSRAYKIRYHLDFIPFHNPIDIEFWKKSQRTNYEISDSPGLLYAGRIGPGIQDSLQTIAAAIVQVNTELKISMKFILHTSEKPLWVNEYSCVVHQGFVAYNDLPKIFSEVDFLILPYDFSEESINFIRYSMPTKATEYMMSGTPIIIFSPKDTAIVKYAEMYHWAVIVTENKVSALAEAIKQAIQNKQIRESITTNAKLIAEQNHGSELITHNFRKVISSLIPSNS